MRISDWSSDVCSSDLIAMPDHADPFALFQCLDYLGTDRHTANLFNFAAGNRLPVGDQGQGFQHRTAVTGLTLGPQAGDPGMDFPAHRSEERRVGKECVSTC